MDEKLFLGLDLSTQRLKATVINGKMEVVFDRFVQFDVDLPEFQTTGGVHESVGHRVTSPVIMWIKALDMVLDQLKTAGIHFGQVAAVSGAGQQHGSVYWRIGAKQMLKDLKPGGYLHEQIAQAFSLLDSPVWMDSSTRIECQELEAAIGGSFEVAKITGASAFERFTGNQIRKIYKEKPEVYANTERISLVSSFLATLFLGDYASIEMSDACGMNLYDLQAKKWSAACLKVCAHDLKGKLGPNPVKGDEVLGNISKYMVERYGFDKGCSVVPFTGDNPSSLAGMGMQPGDVALTLGTSDCLFVWLDRLPHYLKADAPSRMGYGVLLVNPVDNEAYMGLICWKNGSLTRERIRDEVANGDWDEFNRLLDSRPRGNFLNLGMYYTLPEITPNVQKAGDFRFNKAGDLVAKFASKEAEVRAVIEGQMLSKRIHAEHMGFSVGESSRILVTGGASVNSAILQVISNVFNAPVFTSDSTSNAAGMGACLRALHAHLGGEGALGFTDLWKSFQSGTGGAEKLKLGQKCQNGFVLKSLPNSDAESIYNPLVDKYRVLEEKIASGSIR